MNPDLLTPNPVPCRAPWATLALTVLNTAGYKFSNRHSFPREIISNLYYRSTEEPLPGPRHWADTEGKDRPCPAILLKLRLSLH